MLGGWKYNVNVLGSILAVIDNFSPAVVVIVVCYSQIAAVLILDL